jgi:hypothetical protein
MTARISWSALVSQAAPGSPELTPLAAGEPRECQVEILERLENDLGDHGLAHHRNRHFGDCGDPIRTLFTDQMSKYSANSHGCGRSRIASTSLRRL